MLSQWQAGNIRLVCVCADCTHTTISAAVAGICCCDRSCSPTVLLPGLLFCTASTLYRCPYCCLPRSTRSTLVARAWWWRQSRLAWGWTRRWACICIYKLHICIYMCMCISIYMYIYGLYTVHICMYIQFICRESRLKCDQGRVDAQMGARQGLQGVKDRMFRVQLLVLLLKMLCMRAF